MRQTLTGIAGVLAISLLVGGMTIRSAAAEEKAAPAGEKATGGAGNAEVKATVVGVEYEGSKLWLPGTIVARKGDRVKITLISKIPSDPPQHGFAIDAYKVAEVVNRGETKTVEFVADKPGVFPIYCQLHPAHVGGQLVVLDTAH